MERKIRNQTTKFSGPQLSVHRCVRGPVLDFFSGITFTLLRKFRVEFMAALYLASNMHEPAFKPVPVAISSSGGQ